jgi:hypothetical protein
MQAPLGRAVIGGLIMSTFATLLVVPSIFALVIGKRSFESPSIYPDDPESTHYDPEAYAEPGDPGREEDADGRQNGHHGEPAEANSASNGHATGDQR